MGDELPGPHCGSSAPRNALRALRSRDAGLAGQGARFVLAGGVVAAIYVIATTVLAQAVGLPFQIALALGFALALCAHFSLQRYFVWASHHDFALAMHEQAGRYLLVAACQYGITVAATSTLPSALGLPVEVVYLATTFVVSVVNFVLFRERVFHAADNPATRV